jgi:hypothetical protein
VSAKVTFPSSSASRARRAPRAKHSGGGIDTALSGVEICADRVAPPTSPVPTSLVLIAEADPSASSTPTRAVHSARSAVCGVRCLCSMCYALPFCPLGIGTRHGCPPARLGLYSYSHCICYICRVLCLYYIAVAGSTHPARSGGCWSMADGRLKPWSCAAIPSTVREVP